MIPTNTGVLIDTRDEYEKKKDHLHEEVASGFQPYVWEERPAKASYYYPYNQSSSLSCVAGGGAIVLEDFDGNTISRKDIYVRRVNYPQGGMILNDIGMIICKGVSREKFVPSQGQGENDMNTKYPITNEIIKSRAENKAKLFFTVQSPNNIDTMASIMNITPVIAFWYFDENGKEWWKPYPTVQFDFKTHVDNGVTRHQVAIVDAILIDGKKFLIGQDTAGVGSGVGEHKNLRYISEDTVTKRLYAAGYAIDDDTDVLIPVEKVRPTYFNTKPLSVGSTGDAVRMLQAVLIYEGLLQIKEPTGVFGGLTRKAVMALQTKYKSAILTPAGLKGATGVCGTLTNLYLNKNYK